MRTRRTDRRDPPVPVRAWLTRLTAPLVWRSPARAARLLASFSRAESSSMLDLLAAAGSTPSPERRALYLLHALDEERHARSFASRARQLAQLDPGQADFDGLYDRLGEVGFLAYVHRGEARGRAQFAEHRRVLQARGDEQGARQFEAILVDEERHERYTGELLVALTHTPRRELRRAALREALWRWHRAGRVLSGLVFTVLASALFVMLLPFALVERTRARQTGWREAP